MCLIGGYDRDGWSGVIFLCGIRKNTDLFLMDGLERLLVKKGMHFISAGMIENSERKDYVIKN